MLLPSYPPKAERDFPHLNESHPMDHDSHSSGHTQPKIWPLTLPPKSVFSHLSGPFLFAQPRIIPRWSHSFKFQLNSVHLPFAPICSKQVGNEKENSHKRRRPGYAEPLPGGCLGIFLSIFQQQTVGKLWSWPLRLQLLHKFSSVIRPFNS